MKPAEREAALQRQRELAALYFRAERRARVVRAASAVGGIAGFSAGFPLARMLVRHEPFSVATMGLAAAACTTVYLIAWGCLVAWERWWRGD